MLCPECRKVMIIVESARIELDYCTNCGGVWFDTTELELFLEAAGLPGADFSLEALLRLPEVKETPHPRKCPICLRKMREIAIGEPAIIIDVCRRGEGIWFDGGEVRQLLTQLAAKAPSGEGASQRVMAFLGDTFKAKKQDRQEKEGL
jgi:Zn-finger nucleic acid-binding protein